jgi:glycosyltransferase involved in cell wall biosynthesis
MNELVSIIVPVYNTEEYLDRCINSIISQTYPNLQIILVDDGSADGSGGVCDKYAAMDNRI